MWECSVCMTLRLCASCRHHATLEVLLGGTSCQFAVCKHLHVDQHPCGNAGCEHQWCLALCIPVCLQKLEQAIGAPGRCRQYHLAFHHQITIIQRQSMCNRVGTPQGCADMLQACKDKKSLLLESMDKVKLSYSQLTAQTAELTQQVLHMTSHVQSQVHFLVFSISYIV